MEQDDRRDGDGPQPVYVLAKSHLSGTPYLVPDSRTCVPAALRAVAVLTSRPLKKARARVPRCSR